MRFDEPHGLGRHVGVRVGPLEGQELAVGARGGEALGADVGAAAQPADHRANAIPIGDGVLESFEDQHGAALAHDKAVRPLVKGGGGRGGQGVGLAELHIAAGAHVSVHATGDGHVALAVAQRAHGSGDRRQGRRAGRVHRVVGAREPIGRGHPTGHHVGELTGHGVFVDGRARGVELLLQVCKNLLLGVVRHPGEPVRLPQVLPEDLEGHAGRGGLPEVATDGVAQDHRAAFPRQAIAREACVGQGRLGDVEGEQLGVVYRFGHHGRDAPLA